MGVTGTAYRSETHDTAMTREIYEETGMVVNNLDESFVTINSKTIFDIQKNSKGLQKMEIYNFI